MKIETRELVITDVPGIHKIVVTEGLATVDWVIDVAWSADELRQLRDAIDVALKALTSSMPAPSDSGPWKNGDPEPTGVTRVRDRDGDIWVRGERKWSWNGDRIGWADLVRQYGPVTLP